MKGAHQLKFGLDYRHYRTSGKFNSFQASVTYADTGFINNVPGTILSGLGSATISVTRPGVMLFNSWSSYVQDTWKLKPRLTLTYGLRWEVEPPPGAGNGLQPFAVTEVSDPATMGLAPAGTSLYHTRYRNFAPRAGIAYQLSRDPTWMSVVRAGFGGFYDTGFGALSSLLAFQPFVATGTLSNIRPRFIRCPVRLNSRPRRPSAGCNRPIRISGCRSRGSGTFPCSSRSAAANL